MTVTIHPSGVDGAVQAPASKSSMQRACAAALLHEGTTVIHNPGESNDDQAACEVITHLGARILSRTPDELLIESRGVHPVSGTMHCGESGLGIRMFTPVAALSDQPVTITGSGSLVARPMDFFDAVLPQLGVSIRSNGGRLPLEIQGPLQPAAITVDGSLSSQFLTGLLMAFARAAQEPVTITVLDLKSRPYIDLTLDVLRQFGYQVSHQAYHTFTITPVQPGSHTVHYTVEGDWSGGAFLLVAGAVSGSVEVRGLDAASSQADKAILEALRDSGAVLSIGNNRVTAARPEPSGGPLQAFRFDATDSPDLFPPLVALAACCMGNSLIKGVSRLAHKESNRGLTLQEEFGKMGVEVLLEGDWMEVKGGGQIKSARVHSRHDHRIAMACAVAALRAVGPVQIEEAGAISKSYPAFYDHLRLLGVPVSLNPAPAVNQ